MKLSMDELRRLDPKDIGNWPAPLQLGVLLLIFILVAVIGYFTLLDGQNDLLKEGRAKEETLKQDYLDKSAKAVNLDAYRTQLATIQQTFGALLKQLPSKAEMENLITEINQSGVGRGLQFELFKPEANEIRTAEYAERPINVKIVGTYHDLAAFSSDISQLSRIVTLGDIQLAQVTSANSGDLCKQSGPVLMEMQAIARTYRALDAEEAVAIRRAEADKNKKK